MSKEGNVSEALSRVKGPSYGIQAVQRACEILRCFQQNETPLSLNDVVDRTDLCRSTAFRLLQTLVAEGMLERLSKNQYRNAATHLRRKRYRFGYASQSEEFSFSRLVSESIRSSAFSAGVELVELCNRYSPTVAIRNADVFVRERVDLVIEFQTNQQSASVVASKLVDAGIPIIAIEIPHPGADYYGANNYRAGLLAGHALGQAAVQEWDGHVDEIILLELPMAGPLPHSRLVGVLAGIREIIPKIPSCPVRSLNGNGRFESSLQVTRRYLLHNKGRRVLIGAMNDPSCLGAMQAFEEGGRSSHCFAVGQNASIEARRELRRAGTRLVGSVGYFPERYGENVLALALDKLRGKDIPPATFVRHQMITRDNVDTHYPNDKLLTDFDADSLLYSLH